MGQTIILAEAFLSLTHQVQALPRMMQTIIPLVPQLAQQSMFPQSLQPTAPGPPLSWAPQQPVVTNVIPSLEELSENMRLIPEHGIPNPNTLSSDSADSLWAQLRSVNRCLDEVQREFHKSMEAMGEVPPGGSPFVQEVQDKPIPQKLLSSYARSL